MCPADTGGAAGPRRRVGGVLALHIAATFTRSRPYCRLQRWVSRAPCVTTTPEVTRHQAWQRCRARRSQRASLRHPTHPHPRSGSGPYLPAQAPLQIAPVETTLYVAIHRAVFEAGRPEVDELQVAAVRALQQDILGLLAGGRRGTRQTGREEEADGIN